MTAWGPEVAPSDEDFFFDAIEELRRRSSLRASAYDVIRSAGLVRLLLLDPPLYQAINRRFRLRISFEVTSVYLSHTTSSGIQLFTSCWIDPTLTPLLARELASRSRFVGSDIDGLPRSVGSKSLDQFLAHTVAGNGDRPVTVLDLTKWYANQVGGAHREHSGDTADAGSMLAQLVPEAEPLLRPTMAAIGRIVCRALEPLSVTAVLAEVPQPFGLDLDRGWSLGELDA